MSSPNASAPKWVNDLQNPPAPKSKTGSIPDPPGYPSQSTSLSKVPTSLYLMGISHARF